MGRTRLMKPSEDSVVQCAVDDVGVGIACWSVRWDRFPCSVQTISEGLVCQTEFFDARLGCHIKPVLHLQYCSNDRGRRDGPGSVSLAWIAMRCLREQQRAFDIAFKKIGTRPQPIVLIIAMAEMFQATAYQIITCRDVTPVIDDEGSAQTHLNMRVRLPA